jgi:hypothetical protein
VPPALEDARNRDVQVAAFGVEPSPGVVATNHAPRFYLLTGREVVPPFAPGESVPSADTLLRRYCDVHVGVVAVTDSASTAAAAVRAIRAARPEALQPLYELSTGIALYRLTCAQ